MTAALEQAIEWYARQGSGQFDEQDQRRFNQWLEADARHKEAWNSLSTRLQQTFAPLNSSGARRALQTSSTGRRAVLRGALALAGCALGAGLITRPGMPLDALTADLRTGTGERRTLTLGDGTRLTLDAESAVDVDFTPQRRSLRLLRGGLYAQVAPAPVPLALHCSGGSMGLSSGRCLLMQQHLQAEFWLQQGQAVVHPPGQPSRSLKAVSGVRLAGHDVQWLAAPTHDPGAWTRGLLQVQDQSLGQVIERLRPYRHGVLQVSDEAAMLRISGVFSLDDSDSALAALADVLPLRVHRYGGLWTRIERT